MTTPVPAAPHEPAYQTTRIWKRTVRKLKLLSAITGDSMVSILDDLVDRELIRLRKAGQLDAVINEDPGDD